MATQDSVLSQLGLFTTPEQYQQAKNQQLLDQSMQLAKLEPFEGARASTMYGAGLIGRAMGSEDPMLQQLSVVNEVVKGINPNDPRSMMEAAVKLQNIAPAQAADLAQKARAANEQLAKTSSEGLMGKLVVSGKYTPESLAKFQTTGMTSDLEAIDQTTKPSDDWLAQARAMGLPVARSFASYTPEQVAAVNEAVFNKDIQKKRAGATVVNTDLAGVLREVSAKEDAKGKQDAWNKAGEAYKLQKAMMGKLETVEAALPKTLTGSFSDTALAFGKSMSALGLPVDENKLSNTEYMNNVSSQVVQTIARNFPGSLAVKELEELKKSKFNSQQQMQTIIRVLGDLKKEMGANVKTYEQMSKMPQGKRYETDFNSLYGKNLDIMNLESKVNNKTASREEALRLKQLRSEE